MIRNMKKNVTIDTPSREANIKILRFSRRGSRDVSLFMLHFFLWQKVMARCDDQKVFFCTVSKNRAALFLDPKSFHIVTIW